MVKTTDIRLYPFKMHYIFSLLIILPLGIVASPLADITDNPKYYAADQVNAPAIPIFNTDQINDEGAESDVYPEVAFGDTGAKLAGQDDISLSPQPFELAKQVEKTSANPCPGQTTVCAKKTQYFPLFKCYPCEECKLRYQISFLGLDVLLAWNKLINIYMQMTRRLTWNERNVAGRTSFAAKLLTWVLQRNYFWAWTLIRYDDQGDETGDVCGYALQGTNLS